MLMFSNKYVFCLLLFFILAAVSCYPIGNIGQEQLATQKNEKHFPNGTVVGKYSYMDKEGNPVEVKYYADDTSYGVELKSIKVVDTTGDSTIATDLMDYPDKSLISNVPKDVLRTLAKGKKLKTDPLEFIDRELIKLNQHKIDKPSPDFEIYYQNEINEPKKCGKEKVRVYFDKKRKIRNVLDKLEADKYCEQF